MGARQSTQDNGNQRAGSASSSTYTMHSRSGQAGGSRDMDRASTTTNRSSVDRGAQASIDATSSSTMTSSLRRRLLCVTPMPSGGAASDSQVFAPAAPKHYIRLPVEVWEDSALLLQPDLNPNVVKPVGFTPAERNLLLTLWHQIASNTRTLSVKFYVSLITLYPDFRTRFAGVNVNADARIQAHAMAILRYLINLANYIDDEEAFNESVYRLADVHNTVALTKDDLLIINTVFLNMLIKELPNFMYPESAYALIVYLSTVSTRMYRRTQDFNPTGRIRQNRKERFTRHTSSACEELYESITEWHIQLLKLHNKRLALSQSQATASTSRQTGGVLAPCAPLDFNRSYSTMNLGKRKK